MMTDRRSLLSSVVVSMVALRSGSVRLLGSRVRTVASSMQLAPRSSGLSDPAGTET
jgi:hypothetical protein